MRLTQLATFLEDRSVCRRTLLTQYFGETDPSKGPDYNCRNCDTCNNGSVAFVVDAAPLVQAMINEYQVIIQEPRAPYVPAAKGAKGKRAAAPKASHYGRQVASGTIRDRLISKGSLAFLETPRISIRTKTEQRAFFDYVFGKLVLMGIFLDVSSTTKLPRGVPEKAGQLPPCRFMFELVSSSGPARLDVIWKHPPRGGPVRVVPMDNGSGGEEDDIVEELSPPPKRAKRTAKASTASTPSTSLSSAAKASAATIHSVTSPFSRSGKSTASKPTSAIMAAPLRPSAPLELDDYDDDYETEDNVRVLGSSSVRPSAHSFTLPSPGASLSRTTSNPSTLRSNSALGRSGLSASSSTGFSHTAPLPSFSSLTYDVIEVEDFDIDPDEVVKSTKPRSTAASSTTSLAAAPSSISTYFPRASASSSNNSSTNASTTISPPSTPNPLRRNFVVPGASLTANRTAFARELVPEDVPSEGGSFSRPIAARASAPASSNINDPHKEIRANLLGKLKRLRTSIHNEENCVATSGASSVTSLFPDKVLQQIAYVLPRTVQEFASVNGVGEKRAEKYAARFILAIGKVCDAHPDLSPLAGVDVTASEPQSSSTATATASPSKSLFSNR